MFQSSFWGDLAEDLKDPEFKREWDRAWDRAIAWADGQEERALTAFCVSKATGLSPERLDDLGGFRK